MHPGSDVDRASSFLSELSVEPPEVALILGSGLGVGRPHLDDERRFDLASLSAEFDPRILHDRSKVPGHERIVVTGRLAAVPCLFFLGRVHAYEGATSTEITFPVRLAHRLGARRLVATNAAGGITEQMIRGSIVLIDGHLDFPTPAAISTGLDGGPIAYDAELRARLLRAAGSAGIVLRSGTYARVSGPSYETPAEIRAIEILGADVVGMSTVPEIVAANVLGMRAAAISVVTNRAAGRSDEPLTHEEVLAASQKASASLWALLHAFIHGFARHRMTRRDPEHR